MGLALASRDSIQLRSAAEAQSMGTLSRNASKKNIFTD